MFLVALWSADPAWISAVRLGSDAFMPRDDVRAIRAHFRTVGESRLKSI